MGRPRKKENENERGWRPRKSMSGSSTMLSNDEPLGHNLGAL